MLTLVNQVYRAHLKSEFLPPSIIQETTDADAPVKINTQVAIKILHPRVHKTIRRDIAIMSVFANVINLFPGMQWLSLPEEVTVFGEMMESQLDLRVEANNLDRFRVNFAKRGPGIAFPKPFGMSDSAKRGTKDEDAAQILIEEFEDALPMKYFLRNGGGEFDDRIAKMGLDAFLVSSGPMPRFAMVADSLRIEYAPYRQLDARRSTSVSIRLEPAAASRAYISASQRKHHGPLP